MELTYPAIFYPWDDGPGFTVEVPDLPGCVSEGNSLAKAILMGTDAASGWVLTELEDGKPEPKSSRLEDIHPEDGGFVSMLVLDMDAYAEKYGNKAVRKNLTFRHGLIPLPRLGISIFPRYCRIHLRRYTVRKSPLLSLKTAGVLLTFFPTSKDIPRR